MSSIPESREDLENRSLSARLREAGEHPTLARLLAAAMKRDPELLRQAVELLEHDAVEAAREAGR